MKMMTVKVVSCSWQWWTTDETGANIITGEEIELMLEYLVQSFETDNEKQLNTNLMTAQRSQAHHGS
jgi:hypothetical protein